MVFFLCIHNIYFPRFLCDNWSSSHSSKLKNQLLSSEWTGVLILVCNCDTSIVSSQFSTKKSLLIFVKRAYNYCKTVLRMSFLIRNEHARHPCSAKIYHVQFFVRNLNDAFFWDPYSTRNFSHLQTPIFQYQIYDFRCGSFFGTSFTWIISVNSGNWRRSHQTSSIEFLTKNLLLHHTPIFIISNLPQLIKTTAYR